MLALVAYGASAVFGLAREPGCGGADTPSNGPNAPCTRDKDCNVALVCSRGVCTDPDAGSSGNTPPDSGGDASSVADASGDSS